MDLAPVIEQIGMPLIALLVPLAVAFIKTAVWPSIPTWALPILAAGLGPAFDAGIAWAAGTEATGWVAVLLGLAGVGLRELKDQTHKAIAGAKPP